jgi:hypothetical protein
VRAKYLQHIATMLAMSGDKAAAEHAAQILDIETRLAAVQWTRVQMRDPVKSYNRVAFDQFAAMAPAFDWKAYLPPPAWPEGKLGRRAPAELPDRLRDRGRRAAGCMEELFQLAHHRELRRLSGQCRRQGTLRL